MKLTQEQQDMLDDKYGEGTAYAMRIQVTIGESFGAERMVSVAKAHAALSNQKADPWFAEKLLSTGARYKMAPAVDPGFCLSFFESRNMASLEYAGLMQRAHNAYKRLGATPSYNCTPYIGIDVPNHGEVITFSESSATPYINSVWGAGINREGADSALCAAVTGFVPGYGLLLNENKEGNVLVEVQADMRDDYDYRMLGMTGKKISNGIPIFTGLPKRISKKTLGNLGTEPDTSGAYGMYHIVGFTPEAPTSEAAFGGKELERKMVITNEDLQKELKRISPENNRQADFAMFGYPHFALEEVEHIAERTEGKELRREMWTLTSSHVKEMTVCMGLDEIIIQADGFITPDTCPDQSCWGHLNGKIDITESPKCAYYPRRRGTHFVVKDLDTYIETALIGEAK